MAILQADFGCFEEALSAMHESISVARENKDTACLNFSLSWLHHFRTVFNQNEVIQEEGLLSAFPSNSLSLLKTRAIDSKMWAVASSTMLSEARVMLAQGRNPYEVLERLYEAAHLNIEYNLQSAVGTQFLLQSSIFFRLGISSLSGSYCKLVTDCYSGDALAQDFLRARCRRASAAVVASEYKLAEQQLEGVVPDFQRNLHLRQFCTTTANILRLKRCLRRSVKINASPYLD